MLGLEKKVTFLCVAELKTYKNTNYPTDEPLKKEVIATKQKDNRNSLPTSSLWQLWSVRITFDKRNTPFICSICGWFLFRSYMLGSPQLSHLLLLSSVFDCRPYSSHLTLHSPNNDLFVLPPDGTRRIKGAVWKYDNKWNLINQQSRHQSEREGGSE